MIDRVRERLNSRTSWAVLLGSAALLVGFCVLAILVPSRWSPLCWFALTLPVATLAYQFGGLVGSYASLLAALAITFSLLLPRGQVPEPTAVMEALLAGGLIVGGARLAGRAGSPHHAATQQEAASDSFSEESPDLDTVLDSVLGDEQHLIPYDVAELTLWDAERACCITQDWRGSRAYIWEPGGVYSLGEGYAGWIAQHRKALTIPVIGERTDVRPKIDAPDYPFEAFIGTPMHVDGRFIGTLGMFSGREEAFSADDVRVLEAMARQAAVAIENASLYAETERRASELELLARISATFSESLELDHVLEIIGSAMLELIGCQRADIFVVDEPRQRLRLAMTQGLKGADSDEKEAYPLETGGRARAVVTESTVVVDGYGGGMAVEPPEGFRAFIDLPLVRANQTIGMLSALFTARHRFTDEEIELLTTLAGQAAAAIENARLYAQTDRELQRQVEALSSLERVSREINATLNLDFILPLVLEEAMQLSGASWGAIVLRDAHSGELSVEVCDGFSAAEETSLVSMLLKSPPERTIMARVLSEGESLRLSDLTVPTASGPGTELASTLVVPVFYAKMLAGLILLASDRRDALGQQTVEFVEGLSAQAAIAIGNARRYDEQVRRGRLLRRRADQLAMVLEISRALRSDRPLEDILEEVAYAIQESVGYNIVLISVQEGEPPYRRRVAGAGIPISELEEMKEERRPWSEVAELMVDEFRISQSYWIPFEESDRWRGRLDVYESEPTTGEREADEWHPGDLLLVPLVGPGGDTQGLISVDQPQDGKVPDRPTVEALEIFAAQAALGIENVRMVEELERRADTLALFNEVSRSATAKLELDEVLNTVVGMVARLLDYDTSCVFLLDEETERYVPSAVRGFDLETIEGLSFARGEGIVGQVGASGMPIAIDDVADEEREVPEPLSDRMRAMILSPLTSGDEVIGVLSVGYSEPHRCGPVEVATLSALADQVSVAVENARLFDRVSRFSQVLEQRVEERTQELAAAMEDLTVERDRVETLYRITAQLSASLDLGHVLNRALELVLEAVGAEQAFALLLESDTQQLVCRAARGDVELADYVDEPIRFDRGEGLAWWVVEQRQGVIIPDTREDDRWAEPREGAKSYRSALGAPLLAGGGEVKGALLLFRAEPGYFDEEHLRLVETAARQVANSINNAGLYEVIVEQTNRLGRMLKAREVEAAKSQSILEGVADGVMVTDAQGEVILFNAAAERILDLPREEAMGRTINAMLGLYGAEAQSWMETVGVWRADPTSYDAEEFLAARLAIGDRIVSVHLAPVLMEKEFLGTVSVFRDVTAEVEAERAKTEFVSMVSHELRTPMTSIKGYVDLLLMGATGDVSDQQERFLKIIRNNTDRLTDLVNDLLDISRMESGRMELELREVQIRNLIAQVVDALQPRAESKALSIGKEIAPDLPPVIVDPDRIIQVLTNLMANAYQYTPDGGEIKVSAWQEGDELRVAVRDTGIGISDEDKENLFVRFFRAEDPIVQEAPGTGLGLSIVQSLVMMHGGRIWVESELGEGSTFIFSLPTAEAWRAGRERRRGDGSKKILVVEDDKDVARLIQLQLKNDGRNVMVARCGDEALRAVQDERPDLITLDVLLPDVDGYEIMRALKADPSTEDIPVIVVSVLEERKKEGLQLGAVDYVPKPIDERRLLRAVHQALN